MRDPVISVRELRKSYGDVEAVRGIDLEVAAGEIFAFVGPNGAGKTTTVEILEGYRARTGGEATVLDTDPASAGREWRERVGIVLQECRMQPELTVRETVEQYAGYYRRPRPVRETIELVGLTDKAGSQGRQAVGGQQRRLDVALALIGDPELLFLDEPTTGFDPTARRHAWGMIASLRELGKTVFLTTHYMEEAQELATGWRSSRAAGSSPRDRRTSSRARMKRWRSVSGCRASRSRSPWSRPHGAQVQRRRRDPPIGRSRPCTSSPTGRWGAA